MLRRTGIIAAIVAGAFAADLMAQSQQQRDRRQNASQRQADWESTTVIGYDLDADGQTDVYYTVSRYELERIRSQMRDAQRRQGQQSFSQQQRMAQQRARADAQRRMDQRAQFQQTSQRQRQAGAMTLSGTVQDMKRFRLAGAKEQTTFAQVRTGDGKRVIVNLGPASDLRTLKLSEGDQLSAQVTRGTVDDRQVLVARQIRVDGNVRTIRHPRAADLQRIEGRILSTTTRQLRDRQGTQKHVIAQVRSDTGRTHTVSLGPADQIDRNRIDQGDSITVLAKRATVNGRPFYAAKQVSLEGDMIRSGEAQIRSSRFRR